MSGLDGKRGNSGKSYAEADAPDNFFRESSFRRQLSLWNKDRVFSVLELLYKCERDCKTTNLPVPEIVSYTLMQISSAAARAGRGV